MADRAGLRVNNSWVLSIKLDDECPCLRFPGCDCWDKAQVVVFGDEVAADG